MRVLSRVLAIGSCGVVLVLGALWIYAGTFGLNVLLRHGGTYWISMSTDDERLSPAMRLALRDEVPPAQAGAFTWRRVAPGFEVAELPVLDCGGEVDRIDLARIDPARFRFELRNAAEGDKDLDQWMASLGAALVINGSYYAPQGTPSTPFVSAGKPLGPQDYDAKSGAFVVSASGVGIRDLAREDWHAAFRGAEQAMVSYPMLVTPGRANPVSTSSRWLANRSFVGQDDAGRIVLGTTRDAFFPLDRFANFLRRAPLGLTHALNLDGGPIASQGISIAGFQRRTIGKWELRVHGDDAKLLSWPYGTLPMPVVLAVFPK